MTYADIVSRLGFEGVCLRADCGLTDNAVRGCLDPFGVVHWRERRVTRRGLRRFLLLVAKRERLADRIVNDAAPVRGYLNARRHAWLHTYLDARQADRWAAELGVRFPVEFSRQERSECLYLAWRSGANLSKRPAIYSWAYRGMA